MISVCAPVNDVDSLDFDFYDLKKNHFYCLQQEEKFFCIILYFQIMEIN